jgi:transposase
MQFEIRLARSGGISAMQQALRRASLVPTGFVVESAFCEADKIAIAVYAVRGFGLCPLCGTVSRRVHSRYRRRVTDLPSSGRSVQLVVIARRFRCVSARNIVESGKYSRGSCDCKPGFHAEYCGGTRFASALCATPSPFLRRIVGRQLLIP